MIFSQFKCEKCNTIFDVEKESILDNFSDIKVNCPNCKSEKTHYYWILGPTDIATGNCGTAKDGYSHSFVYHPSKFGRPKGMKVKNNKG